MGKNANFNEGNQEDFLKKILNSDLLFYWKKNVQLSFKDSLASVGIAEMSIKSILNPLIYLILTNIIYFYLLKCRDTWNDLYKIILSAIIVFLGYFIFRILFVTPFKIYDEEKQKNNNNLKNKENFIIDIRPIREQVTYYDPLNKDAPLYNKALLVLKRHASVSKIWIDIFKNDECLRTRYDSSHSPSALRLRLLNEIINSFVP